MPVSLVVAKKHFSVEGPSASRPSFEAALEKKLRSRVRKEAVVVDVMPQFSKGDINNNLILYTYGLPAFEIQC